MVSYLRVLCNQRIIVRGLFKFFPNQPKQPPSSFLPQVPNPPRLSPPQTLHTSPRRCSAVPAAQPHRAAPARPRGPVTASPPKGTAPCGGSRRRPPPTRRRPPPPPLMSPTCDLGFLWPRSQKSSQEVPRAATSGAQRLASPPQRR